MTWLREFTLHNWRAYKKAEFVFPAYDDTRKVVLIGAKNGVGKTSLLEAATLCICGEYGLRYLLRSEKKLESRVYHEFIEGCFYEHAIEPWSCVEMTFDLPDDRSLAIRRVWHFGQSRRYRDEDLQVFENGVATEIPGAEAMKNNSRERSNALNEKIARVLLPNSLASYFLFDSGHVQRLARTNMVSQVKQGIEGILGVRELEKLWTELQAYATSRRNLVGKFGDEEVDRSKELLDELMEKINELKKAIEKKEAELDKMEDDIEALVEEITSLGGDNVEVYGKKLAELAFQEKQLNTAVNNLQNCITKGDFSLTLAGSSLLAKTSERLLQEQALAEWNNNKITGTAKFDEFISGINSTEPSFEPALTRSQEQQLANKLRKAWDELWHPPPKNCAPEFMHNLLDDSPRRFVIERLDEVLKGSIIGELRQLRTDITLAKERIESLESEIILLRPTDPDKAKELKEKLEFLIAERRKIDNELNKLNQQLKDLLQKHEDKSAEFERLNRMYEKGKPQLRRANQGERAASLSRSIIENVYPEHVRHIAEHMASAYISMSRKGLVSKIEIDDDCTVRLLTDAGEHVNAVDPSHGESQIFSLALISAIVSVSKFRFPFLIDTPLANLDKAHRKGFLEYFSVAMGNQVILLSTDEEVRTTEYNLIKPRLSAKMLILQDDTERTSYVVKDKYFEV